MTNAFIRPVLVKYTDVDYMVFDDAARFIAEGRSPFERSTYRYTPLLYECRAFHCSTSSALLTKAVLYSAMILIPNVYLHKSFGKVLFALADMLIGALLLEMLQIMQTFNERHASSQRTLLLLLSTFLFNPVVVNVSTRGNAESLVGLTVIATLYFLLTKRWVLASMW